MQLHPEEAQRIAALLILAIFIVLGSAVRAYWPEDQRAPAPPKIERELTQAERYVLGEPIDLNAASAEELELLPGVGPKLAARIAEAAPFNTIEEVDQIPGVGPFLIARFKEDTIIRAPTSRSTIPASPARR